MTYWWCLKHMRVEDEQGCAHADRLGPYDTEQEAGQALAKARERTAERDAQDAAEDDWGRRPDAG